MILEKEMKLQLKLKMKKKMKMKLRKQVMKVKKKKKAKKKEQEKKKVKKKVKESEKDNEEEQEEANVQSKRRTKLIQDKNVDPSSSNVADVSDNEELECIKSIGQINYSFKTYYSKNGHCSSKFIVRSTLGGKTFIKLRELLINEGILDMFKKSYFGHFLDIPMNNTNFASSI